MMSPRRSLLFVCFALPAMFALAHAQPGSPKDPCAKVSSSWYAIDDAEYGMTFYYGWSEARMLNTDGSQSAVQLAPRLTPVDYGDFWLTSRPIAVSDSSGSIAFSRVAEFYPTEPECGTWLDRDTSRSAWANARDGSTRMVFLQSIDVIDAATGKPLLSRADWKRLRVTRREQLNEMVVDDEVRVDLSMFAGKHIQLRARVISGYSGRGCSVTTGPQMVVTSADGVPCEEDLVLP